MEFNTETLHRLWEVEMEILDVIDRVCRENGLKYSIAYGTMLGGVRHHGFIPWDDDMDIIMPIDDYNELIRIWKDAAPDGYILMNKKTNDDFSQNFTKIRKNHTTFLQTERQKKASYQKGIYVDIFPAFRVAPGKISRRLQIGASMIRMLYHREHTSNSGPVYTFFESALLLVPRALRLRILDNTEKYLQKWSKDSNCGFFLPNTIRNIKRVFPNTLFDDIQDIAFEDRKYMCVKDVDVFLRTIYGNYMKLPPEENRVWKHHPIILDFEHNYEELQ